MAKIYVRLKELLNERGLTQAQFAEMSGLRKATISELVNNQRMRLEKRHLETIITTLELKDINELLTLEEAKKDEAEGEESTNQ